MDSPMNVGITKYVDFRWKHPSPVTPFAVLSAFSAAILAPFVHAKFWYVIFWRKPSCTVLTKTLQSNRNTFFATTIHYIPHRKNFKRTDERRIIAFLRRGKFAFLRAKIRAARVNVRSMPLRHNSEIPVRCPRPANESFRHCQTSCECRQAGRPS